MTIVLDSLMGLSKVLSIRKWPDRSRFGSSKSLNVEARNRFESGKASQRFEVMNDFICES